MAALPVRLKLLLEQQHYQTYRTFRKEYDKAAKSIDPELIGTAPSRAQFYRWLTGDLKGLPFPDHCRVLERMFLGMTAAQLFESVAPEPDEVGLQGKSAMKVEIAHLAKMVGEGLEGPGLEPQEWGSTERRPPLGHDRFNEVPSLPQVMPLTDRTETAHDNVAQNIARKLAELKRVMRFSEKEIHKIASLAGNVVELDLSIQIDIAQDGWASLTYRHHLLNLCDKPLARVPRELWFEHTRGPLKIVPLREGNHCAAIERIHDTSSLAKFACRVSPPIRTGDAFIVGYTCEGGRFIHDHYWRQSIARYTRHFTLRLRHRGAKQLVVCTAVEEHPDGSENSATVELMWDFEDDDVVITLTRDYLRPGQAVTLRWDVGDEDQG